MLKIRLEVQKIDYEKCFESLIPQLIEDCSARTDLTELEKLLVKLGPGAVPVMEKLLRYLDTDARDQLFVWLLEDQQDMFVTTANTELKKMLSGDAVVIGGLYGKDQPGPRITVYATQVHIDYRQLVDSPVFGGGIVGGAAKLALRFSDPSTLEKQGIHLLSSDAVKPMLISVLSKSLQEAGLFITLSDVVLTDDPVIELPQRKDAAAKDQGLLPDAIEDLILDAVAAWLRDSV